MQISALVRAGGRGLVAVVSAGALIATGVGWTLQQRVTTAIVTSDAVAPHAVPYGQAFTALLVGLDARTDANGNPLPAPLLDALHAGPDEGQLHTDTIILLHVPARPTQPAVAISIPRDSFVALSDGSGKHKINSAYDRALTAAERQLTEQGVTGSELDRRGREAGRAALIATVESLTGLQIDHYAEINLAGFVELTEAIGGVPVCLNNPVHDTYSGVDLPAGPQVVTGAAALAFVRQRHGLAGGDLDRITRQQAFIAGLSERMQSEGALTDPASLSRLLALVTRHVVIDKSWDLQQAVAQVGRLAGGDLRFRTIPTGRPDLPTPVDGVAVQVDPAAVQAFVSDQFWGGSSTSAAPIAAPTTATAAAQAPPATPATASTAPITPTAPTTPTGPITPTGSPAPTTGAGGVPCVN